MKEGDTVQLKGTRLFYTVLGVDTHYEGTAYEIKWARLRPPAPATHTAHWPLNQLQPATP